ncbi:apolipoprotein N-acyltransferase [Nocardioidaceae bacterium]|nr:apolipoprotein N-acyltransferase [Nocardioidaceae bacterium]
MTFARACAAVVTGMLLAVSVAPLSLWWAAPLGVAALGLAVWRARLRTAAWLGLLAGLVWFGVAVSWVSRVAFAAWPGLALVEGVYVAVLAVGLAALSRLPAAPWWQAALWATVETVRSSWPLGGFPWLRLAHTTPDSPLSSLLPLLGVVGTSLAVALVGTSLCAVLLAAYARRPRRVLGATVGVVVVAGTSLVTLLLLPVHAAADTGVAGEDLQVALVQGGITAGSSTISSPDIVLDNHVAATLELAAAVDAGELPPLDLVVWPENASDDDPFRDPTVFAAITGAVRAVGAPALTGIVVDRDPASRAAGLRWANRVQVWDAAGEPRGSYDKQHGVPFGEYVPLRDLLTPLFPQLAAVPQDMRPGIRPGVLAVPRVGERAPAGGQAPEEQPRTLPVGVLICFEVADVGLARDAVADGAQVIAVPTNNATYLGTPQLAQQLQIARTTAMATHRPLLIAATNGLTALVDADGEVRTQLPLQDTGVLTAAVKPRADLVPAVAHGLLIDRIVWLVAALGVLLAVMAARLRGRRETSVRSGGEAA